MTWVSEAVEGEGAVGAERSLIVAAAGCKPVTGVDVTVGRTWTLPCRPTSAANPEISASLSRAGLNHGALLRDILLSNVEPCIAPSAVVGPALGVWHTWACAHQARVGLAGDWEGAVRADSRSVFAATGGVGVCWVDITVRRPWALSSASSSTVDSKVSPILTSFYAHQPCCCDPQCKSSHQAQQNSSSHPANGWLRTLLPVQCLVLERVGGLPFVVCLQIGCCRKGLSFFILPSSPYSDEVTSCPPIPLVMSLPVLNIFGFIILLTSQFCYGILTIE